MNMQLFEYQHSMLVSKLYDDDQILYYIDRIHSALIDLYNLHNMGQIEIALSEL